eukprot:CAMPEP_0179619632 /NCGR_PEP_ID=MMETSP0932-20121108/256_1 /TAXON_ID=548131 ORGANISM="Ostreococcus mediterraneus, Strain clade-D-RCC2596" /NCGR_SAMPLE_ID=MMETSP0932 /ASSEMBLY_ACC=CAM_ASM_000582 /LENGTH=81 /DNA_ID=CAMNT_0021488615 /DNA_START=462 /DNA_END=707 /DNA_ORIENTATION=-
MTSAIYVPLRWFLYDWLCAVWFVDFAIVSDALDYVRVLEKNHRNGIKKPKRVGKPSTKGMDKKFLRNQKWAKKHNKVAGKA